MSEGMRLVGPDRNAEPLTPLQIMSKALALVSFLVSQKDAAGWVTFFEEIAYRDRGSNLAVAKMAWSTGNAVERERGRVAE